MQMIPSRNFVFASALGVGVATLAFAQTAPSPQPNPVQDSIAQQMGNLIIANAQCSQGVLALQGELRASQAEATRLKAKYEPKVTVPQGKPEGKK